jgi:hypothetical protein
MSDVNLRAYQSLDKESGEIIDHILYREGYPRNVRADMKFGQFFIGESKENGRPKLDIPIIAYRAFRGQMHLDNDTRQAMLLDEELASSSVKDWIEVFWLDTIAPDFYAVTVTLFKTWSASAIKKAITAAEPVKIGNRFIIPKTHNLVLSLVCKSEKNAKGQFFRVEVSGVRSMKPEFAAMVDQFIEDYPIYCVHNMQENMRYHDTYEPKGKPYNVRIPMDSGLTLPSAGNTLELGE